MFRFKLPDIGEGVVEAEIVSWKVREGDVVEENQLLVELLTDKASLEIPAPCAGRVARLHFREGEIAPVGAVLLELEESEERGVPRSTPSPAPIDRSPASEPVVAVVPPEAPAEVRSSKGGEAHPPQLPPRPQSKQLASLRPERRVRATPAVRSLAKRLGLDLNALRGSGPDGRIMRSDVEALAATGPAISMEPPDEVADQLATQAEEPSDWQRRPLRGVRRAIAARMQQSVLHAAHFTYVDEVDVTSLLERNALLGEGKLSPLAFVARAVVRTLPRFPILNASIDEEREEIIEKGKIHLGIATAVDEILLVPVIHDASELQTRALAERIASLADCARAGTLEPAALRGSTFTITSLGKLGGLVATPILNPPESAILAINKLRTEPRYVEGNLEPRQLFNLSLSVDHRIADGITAALFVQALRGTLASADFPDLFDREGATP